MSFSDQSAENLQVEAAIARDERKERIQRVAGFISIAAGIGLGAGLAAMEIGDQTEDLEYGYSVSYIPEAQSAIESVDDVLGVVGGIVVPVGMLIVGGSMIRGGSRNRWASNDLDGQGDGTSKARQALQVVAAGKVPALAALGAGLATFSTAIGGAITEGPSDPIESISLIAPGESWIVQDDDSKPMVQSNLSEKLTGNIMQKAAANNVQATSFNLHLGDIEYDGLNYSNLSVGLIMPEDSPLRWDGMSCYEIPMAIDEAAKIPNGSIVELNGVTAEVVAQQSDTSAVNRIGATIDSEALAQCINKGPENMHAIVLDTDTETAQEILGAANQNTAEAATVITKDRYIENSEGFWRANVKPITNVLSFVSLGFAGVAMAGAAGSRLYRSRRQWAQKMADGVSSSAIRTTELVRSVKEGLFASVLGVAGAAAASPMVGIFESGLNVTTGPRAWLVGGAVGVLGPVLGTLSKVTRLNKTVDKSRDTRGV